MYKSSSICVAWWRLVTRDVDPLPSKYPPARSCPRSCIHFSSSRALSRTPTAAGSAADANSSDSSAKNSPTSLEAPDVCTSCMGFEAESSLDSGFEAAGVEAGSSSSAESLESSSLVRRALSSSIVPLVCMHTKNPFTDDPAPPSAPPRPPRLGASGRRSARARPTGRSRTGSPAPAQRRPPLATRTAPATPAVARAPTPPRPAAPPSTRDVNRLRNWVAHYPQHAVSGRARRHCRPRSSRKNMGVFF